MIRFSHYRIALLTLVVVATASAPVRADEPKTQLGKQMAGMARDFRSLRKALTDPAQKDQAMQLVKDIETRATKAKELEPEKTKEIPAADKDKFIADYKQSIDGLLADVQKLEAAVSSGDNTTALSLMDKINGDKRQGHKKFNADDGKH